MNQRVAQRSVQGVTAMRSFDEIYDQVGEACDWISSMEVPVSGTRLAMYQRDIAELAANYRGGQEALDRLMKRFPNLLNSALEAMDLVTIHRGLVSHPDQDALRERLRMLISGPEFGSNEKPESSSNRARNYGFELLMAARAAAGGYRVDLSHIADLVLRKGEKTIYIECKRPQSAGKLNRNVKDAMGQLKKRMDDDPTPMAVRAVLAVAVDKIIPVAHKVLHTTNEHTAGKTIERLVTKLHDEHHSILKSTHDRRTIGVFLSLRTLTILADHNLITVACHDSMFERTGKFAHTGIATDGSPTAKPPSVTDRMRAEEDYQLIQDFCRSYKSVAYL